jgi:predicted DNA binding protein
MIAEFRGAHAEFPLAETLASMAELEVRSNFQPSGESDGRIVHFTVSCPDFETFHDHLENDRSVAGYTVLRTLPSRRCYRINFRDEVRRLAPTVVEEGLLIERLRNADGEWEFRVFAPDRETLLEAIDHCKERCRSFTLTQLYTGTADEAEGRGLTTAQRETLCLAQREGFFDVPRGISQAELAEQLGVSTSAVSQRIRKGLDVILEDALDPNSS